MGVLGSTTGRAEVVVQRSGEDHLSRVRNERAGPTVVGTLPGDTLNSRGAVAGRDSIITTDHLEPSGESKNQHTVWVTGRSGGQLSHTLEPGHRAEIAPSHGLIAVQGDGQVVTNLGAPWRI